MTWPPLRRRRGFTGSKIWPYVAMFPPVPDSVIEDGYADFAARWDPILDVFDDQGVRFAHEVHPSEIAYDYWSTKLALDVIGRRPAFGLNWDPSHMLWQEIDPVGFPVDQLFTPARGVDRSGPASPAILMRSVATTGQAWGPYSEVASVGPLSPPWAR